MELVQYVSQGYLMMQLIRNAQFQQLRWFPAVNQQFSQMEFIFVQLACKDLLWTLQMQQPNAIKLSCIVPLIQAQNQQFVQVVYQDTFYSTTPAQNSQLNALLLTQREFVFNVLQVTQLQMVHVCKLLNAHQVSMWIHWVSVNKEMFQIVKVTVHQMVNAHHVNQDMHSIKTYNVYRVQLPVLPVQQLQNLFLTVQFVLKLILTV